jgi:hypothetical protein
MRITRARVPYTGGEGELRFGHVPGVRAGDVRYPPCVSRRRRHDEPVTNEPETFRPTMGESGDEAPRPPAPIVLRSPRVRARSHVFIFLRLAVALAAVALFRMNAGLSTLSKMNGMTMIGLEFTATAFAVFGPDPISRAVRDRRKGEHRQAVLQIAEDHGVTRLEEAQRLEAVAPPLKWLVVPAAATLFITGCSAALVVLVSRTDISQPMAVVATTGYAAVATALTLAVNLGVLGLIGRRSARPVVHVQV